MAWLSMVSPPDPVMTKPLTRPLPPVRLISPPVVLPEATVLTLARSIESLS